MIILESIMLVILGLGSFLVAGVMLLFIIAVVASFLEHFLD